MKILCIGDVVGSAGCEMLRRHLPSLKKLYGADMCIVNGENSAVGNGILPQSADHIFTSGADVITGGNHIYQRREIIERLDDDPFILRPANYSSRAAGHGSCICDFGRVKVGVINLAGVVYMEPADNPFDAADREIGRMRDDGVKIIIVDIHAEATAEKRAIAFYLDGRVSAVFGTHTHVQTADASVLPKGTGYISDIGMCGAVNSVLGIKPELAIAKMRDNMPVRFENADTEQMINGVLFDIDDASGLCTSATAVDCR